jgi:hypothetical protein
MIIQFEPKPNPYGLSPDELANARMLAEQLLNTPPQFRMGVAVMAIKMDRKDKK